MLEADKRWESFKILSRGERKQSFSEFMSQRQKKTADSTRKKKLQVSRQTDTHTLERKRGEGKSYLSSLSFSLFLRLCCLLSRSCCSLFSSLFTSLRTPACTRPRHHNSSSSRRKACLAMKCFCMKKSLYLISYLSLSLLLVSLDLCMCLPSRLCSCRKLLGISSSKMERS